MKILISEWEGWPSYLRKEVILPISICMFFFSFYVVQLESGQSFPMRVHAALKGQERLRHRGGLAGHSTRELEGSGRWWWWRRGDGDCKTLRLSRFPSVWVDSADWRIMWWQNGNVLLQQHELVMNQLISEQGHKSPLSAALHCSAVNKQTDMKSVCISVRVRQTHIHTGQEGVVILRKLKQPAGHLIY